MRAFLAVCDPRRWWSDWMGIWQDTRLIVLTAQIAAIYAAILIPFKAGIPIVPGFVELRPANAIPIVASLLFGPAAAWGAGIGNVIGDCFGTLGPASVFGFLGNFALGYLPFLLWGHVGGIGSGQPPVVKSWKQGVAYGAVCFVASAACAGIIGWGVEWLGLLPFAILFPAIFFNNVVMGLLLGPPLLAFLYPRVQRWQLLYQDIQRPFSNNHTFSPTRRFMGPSPCPPGKETLNPPVLDFQEVSFTHAAQSTPVLREISFAIPPGEILMLLGRSGSGKSTLCYACNGLIPQFIPGHISGMVYVQGLETGGVPVWKQAGRVGLVFQDFETQIIATTVEGELSQPLEYRDPPLGATEMRQRIRHALARVGLEGFNNRDPIAMSGGQRQRLVMASLLVQGPALLVLDEPGSDFDPAGRQRLREVLCDLREEGLSVLMTDHDYDVLSYADRVLVLDEGAIVWEGKPDALLRRPDLMRQWGLRPLALTECFEGLGVDPLPINLEEAWIRADNLGLVPKLHQARPGDMIEQENRIPSSEEATTPWLRVENVSFRYAETSVLQDIDCSVYPGDFVALLGPNGSGKSTLARLLNGLLVPTTGCVLVEGLDTRLTGMTEMVRRVGLVFQNPDHQIFADTIRKEVAFSANNIGCSQEEIDLRVRESLHAVGFSEKEGDKDPFSLRKGERQRIAVASVLATRPKILIFDEPTTGLDALETDRMMAMIRDLNQQGHAIVMITHSMSLVASYAKRCLLLREGKLIGEGSPREIFSRPSLVEEAALKVPAITQFGNRWGQTFLTVEEVRGAFQNGKAGGWGPEGFGEPG